MKIFTKESMEELRNEVILPKVVDEEIDTNMLTEDIFCASCPFCDEDDEETSFIIYENHYYCFNCNGYGDAISFLMCVRRMSFQEAIEYLSEMFDVKLEYHEYKERKRKRTKEDQRKRDLELVKALCRENGCPMEDFEFDE